MDAIYLENKVGGPRLDRGGADAPVVRAVLNPRHSRLLRLQDEVATPLLGTTDNLGGRANYHESTFFKEAILIIQINKCFFWSVC